MKRILLSTVVSMLFIAGCKSNSGDPKLVLSKFFEAIGDKNIAEAKKLVTKDSEAMLNMIEMGMKNPGIKSDDVLNYAKENIEYGDAEVNGDKATVPVKDKRSGEVTNFTLRDEEGEWKVAFDKSTLMEMAQQKMKEHGPGMMRDQMGDSTGLPGDEPLPDFDSIRDDAMRQAQRQIDSMNKK